MVTIDTGRLPEEQYDIIETFRRRYGIQVEVLFPDASAVETMVRRHGVNLFRQAVDRRLLCCHVRKILPLNRALKGLGYDFDTLCRALKVVFENEAVIEVQR